MLLNTFPKLIVHYHSHQRCILQRASIFVCHSTFPWMLSPTQCLWVSESFTHFPFRSVIFVFVCFISVDTIWVWLLCCVRECVCVHARVHESVCACARVSPLCKFTNIRVTVMLSCGFPLQTLLLYHGNI